MTKERMTRATFRDMFKDRYGFRPNNEYSIERMTAAMEAWTNNKNSEFEIDETTIVFHGKRYQYHAQQIGGRYTGS